jgi:hypothetical protein
MDPGVLVEMGGQGALVAVVLAAFKVLESKAAKKNSGETDSRIEILALKMEQCENNLGAAVDELKEFRGEFMEFREEVRLTWERQKLRDEFERTRSSGTH